MSNIQTNKKAVIIGAGIAGIASAIRLQLKGFEVNVYEKNSYPGGKLSVFQLGDYRFDAGPSLFTMPQFVEELFSLARKKTADYFEYVKHPTSCKYFWQDGTQLHAESDVQKFAEKVQETFQIEEAVIVKKLQKAAFINEEIGDLFLEQSLHQPSNFFNLKTLKSILNIGKFDLDKTLHQANQKDVKHPKMVQLFDRFATYNGSNPYKTPGIMGIIPHYEHNVGTFFPTKGMNSITTSLVQLAEDLGVKFQYNKIVKEIILDKSQKKVLGIETENGKILADVVFSNMDIYFTYHQLLPNYPKPIKTLSQERSSSAIVFYWGIRKEFKELDLHNIFFAEDYKAEFEAIFEQKTMYKDPTIYINISSKICKEDAPNQSENWFVMVNAPANIGQNWDELVANTKKNVIEKLNAHFKMDIESLIECEEILDPRTIESKTSSYQGSLYGTSSNSKFSAFLRHPNFKKNIKGLYFVGGSVHPGGGIPLCLLSAKIATNHVS
ncbi:MAG: phytoene desaturase [Flavobacteriia bacterium]|nr:phytoene desaturase [Flavobacteriia bacterium]OIP47765.1 MAG: phytoene dehydrogenase [Flavobacteriaceae bacterium CG2_30_31_66]PIV97455.1 MAG: phytoene desaturase [Flavobacteriaceae bacterium CG17_big_fil_post_rev_8_21_14_2_50_31_13]PIX13197.1 MAG: phytoene desaturase [Flavobacteriaceae bacterium CG_4_8_14_3_um_filter_31_8]PIY14814.1 MAG: phytoene desaturase [Flavobacteriaceae bacterium CG_4_10_14_3_um_filter_31_253]PIZ12162.1 MAG: phytoene desaturase [Flavobacteriaceae bacterium CG_4_10_14